jgi:hypothetical protein
MRVSWNPQGPITAEIEKMYMDRLETAAGYVAGMARSLVPVGKDIYSKGELIHRKGALRRTIRVVRLDGDPKLNIFVIAGKRDIIDYAASVEYGGTHNPEAKPFMRPALRATRNRIMSIMSGGI